MKKRNRRRTMWAGIMILCAGLMAGCAGKQEETAGLAGSAAEVAESGGTLVLKVNPEIAVEYDENGRVTDVYGRNEDGKKIVENYQDYIGKECHEAVEELVGMINEAGYFVEEIKGESRKITIEIETGSILPEEDFLDEIVTGVQTYVKDMQIGSPVVTEEQSGDDQTDVTIYEPEYGAEAYEVVIPPESEEPAPKTAPSDTDAGENTDSTSDNNNKVDAGSTQTDGSSTNQENAAPTDNAGANPGNTSPAGSTGANGGNTEPDGSAGANAGNTSPADSAGANAGNTAPDGTTGNDPGPAPAPAANPPVNQGSPYTDYETPYTEASPYTNYETPYTEASPYTDYVSPYSDYHHEDSHYGDSGYSHYH